MNILARATMPTADGAEQHDQELSLQEDTSITPLALFATLYSPHHFHHWTISTSCHCKSKTTPRINARALLLCKKETESFTTYTLLGEREGQLIKSLLMSTMCPVLLFCFTASLTVARHMLNCPVLCFLPLGN